MKRILRRSATLSVAAALLISVFSAPPAVADPDDTTSERPSAHRGGITRLELTSQGVAFEGRAFGTVGTYEKLRGRAFGELDPHDPRNAVITDLKRAPRNARGMVEYATDVYILKPTDLRRGNHQLFMEVNNRGQKFFGSLNGSPLMNDPTTAADAGDAFVLDQGFSLVWSGWDPSATATSDNLTLSVPIAKKRNGASITGPSYEYLVFDNATTQTAALSYPAATTKQSRATLTVRDRLTDRPRRVPASGWEYVGDNQIRLLPAGTPFRQGAIYEFSYRAKDPMVAGIGFAATRDLVSFLRHQRVDTVGNRNPLAGHAERAVAFAVSQPARYLNDFLWLGFNADARNRPVFDGIENWIGGGTGVALNYRFSQPPRTERIRQNHWYPEGPFPFSYTSFRDPATGKRDGRDEACRRTGTCPKIINLNSSNEYWSKAGSLLHTDPSGRWDAVEPPNVRTYLLSSVEHTVIGNPADSPGVCAVARNTIDPGPVQRALFQALTDWVNRGTPPPASRVPRLDSGTLARVHPTEQSSLGVGVVKQRELGWPSIPGITYTGAATVRNLYDFGPRFHRGIIDRYPPVATGRIYPSYVPVVDADGHEIAGIRMPQIQAPTATHTGWNVRADAFGGPDGCEGWGMTIPLPETSKERRAAKDPRRSLVERYRTHDGYVRAVTKAARSLQRQGLLLKQDADAFIAQARASDVLR